ncbi:hypothetical protein KA005_63815, partial [bacterium]|nr:hypothetical protein [bacterium]
MGLGIKSKFLTHLLIKKKMSQWEELYGPFDQMNYDTYTLKNVHGESGIFYGEIVKWAQDLAPLSVSSLLVGDNKKAGEYIKQKIGFQS